MSVISDAKNIGEGITDAVVPGAEAFDLADRAAHGLLGGSSKAPAKKAATKAKTTDKKKADPAPTQAEETKAIEKELSTGPWADLSSSLVKQYQAELAPVTAAVSGSTIPAAQASAASQAEAALGNTGSSSWLTAEMGAANANAAPVESAMSAYGQQYAAEAGPITKALQAYGQANELEVAYAPEQAWLNALSSHVTSNLSYYGDVPTSDVGTGGGLTSAVAEALQQSGGYPGSTGSGLTPLSSLTPTSTGATKAAKTSASDALSGAAAATSGGSVPSASTNAGSG